MGSGTRTADTTLRLNEIVQPEFSVGDPGGHTLDEGRRAQRPKRCHGNNKDEDSYQDVNSVMVTPHSRKLDRKLKKLFRQLY